MVKKNAAQTCNHSEVVNPSSSTNIIGIMTAKPNNDKVFIMRTILEKKYCGWYKVKLLPDLILQTSHGELNYAYVRRFNMTQGDHGNDTASKAERQCQP